MFEAPVDVRPQSEGRDRQARAPEDVKRAAVELWTTDPCGANSVDLVVGSKEYFVRLDRARLEYMPWIEDALEYASARDLTVLDVGCGQGTDLAKYASAGARAVGVDLTPRHVQIARSHLRALGLSGQVMVADAEHLPFSDAAFDRVSSNGVLHHTPDIVAALGEIRRVLRPGGTATIIVYNRHSLHYWSTQVLWWGLLHGRLFRYRSMLGVLSRSVEFSRIGARPLVKAYAQAELRTLLLRSGFDRISVVARHFHWSDTPFTYPLHLLSLSIPWMGRSRLLDRVGRAAGWYLVGTASTPT